MSAPYPQFVPQSFAQNAAGADRNTIPNAPIGTQRASFNLGFPPLTMTPVVAGGKPMLGPDMNGILYMLSSHSVYQQSGQPYRWSADVVAALAPGGYAVGTMLGSVDGSTLWYNTLSNNTTNPDAGGLNWVAMYSYGITAIAGLAGGSRLVTAVEASRSVIVLSGALVANQQVVLPQQMRRWLIVNTCTGGFSVTVKTVGGSGVVVAAGGFNAPVEVWCDEINIYSVVAPVNLPIDQAPSGLSIAQRTNSGYLLAVYFNQSSPLENLPMSAVFSEYNGDGYLRKISLANFAAQIPVNSFSGQVANAQVPQSAVTQHAAAVLANAALSGVPTTPTAAVGTNNAQVASTAFVMAQNLGVGQTWADVTGSRSIGLNYTNSTGRPIQVGFTGSARRASAGGGTFTAYCGGVQVGAVAAPGSTDATASISFIVPPGATYAVANSGALNGYNWAELS